MGNELFLNWIDEGQTHLPTILLRYYRDLNLSNDELVLILQLKSYLDKGEKFPDTKDIAQNMHMTEKNVFRAIHQLMQKGVITIETSKNEENVTQDAYSLALLWEKILILMKQNDSQNNEADDRTSAKDLLTLFQSEFGRPLSAIETETLVSWQQDDHYSISLIELALKEAVLNQVYSLKYIDRILLNWEKKNIRTQEQVEKEKKKYRKQHSLDRNKNLNDNAGPVPMINWLDNKKDNF